MSLVIFLSYAMHSFKNYSTEGYKHNCALVVDAYEWLIVQVHVLHALPNGL